MGLLGSPEMIIFFKIFPIFPNFKTSFRQNRDREESGKIGLAPPSTELQQLIQMYSYCMLYIKSNIVAVYLLFCYLSPLISTLLILEGPESVGPESVS